jgi:hypothetical protein
VAIIHGDFPIHYERILSNSFGVEVAVRLVLPWYIPDFQGFIIGDDIITHPGFGYSFLIHPKFYVTGKAPEYGYLGIRYRQRNFKQDNEKIVFSDYVVTYGVQFFPGKILLLIMI